MTTSSLKKPGGADLSRSIFHIAAAALLFSGAWFIVHIIRHPFVHNFEAAWPGVRSRAAMAPKGGVLAIGDSITASIYMTTLCGRPAINAGVGGSTSQDWLPHAADLVKLTRPSIVILALGNNDVHAEWKDDYRQLAKLATFAVTPKQPDRAAFIRSLLPAVPVPSQTYDGTHLNLQGGREWVRRVEGECKALGLTH